MSSPPVRFAQFGVGHSHAAGKAQVMADSPDMELAGVWEPDAERRAAASAQAAYAGVRWLDAAEEALPDPTVAAVAVEGDVFQGVAWAQRAVDAGKHVWLDKPAGMEMEPFRRLVEAARARNLQVQLGYMFRYNRGAQFLLDWAGSGRLGDVHAVQGRISLTVAQSERAGLAQLPGGPAFEILCHVIDLVVALLGRPRQVTGILRDHAAALAGAVNNTAVILEYPRALAVLQSTAFEVDHGARRLEVHGTRGSVALGPIEPPAVRLSLDADRDGFRKGPQQVPVADEPRYAASLRAIVGVVRGERPPDRSLDHELAVHETILRAVRVLPERKTSVHERF